MREAQHRDLSATTESLAAADRQQRKRATHSARIAELRPVLQTFVKVMREAGNPGLESLHRERADKLHGSLSGWRLAYECRELRMGGWDAGSWFALRPDCTWLTGHTVDSYGGQLKRGSTDVRITGQASLDQLDGERYVGILDYEGFVPGASQEQHTTIDQAVVRSIGMLLSEFDLRWPD